MKYTESHEWIDLDNQIGKVGITKYAQKELGQIVYIELPEVGQHVDAGQEIAVLESTKAAADIYSPVSGVVMEINSAVKEDLSLINQHPEKEGWLFKIELDDARELDVLHNYKDYMELVSS